MNKKLIFEYYSRLLDKLIDEHDYFKYYFQDPTTQYFGRLRENGLRIRCGIFRGCLISNNCDYVVKFPLSETGEECCEREEVDDLHRNNVGILNGKTVIIDYAGCI